MDIDKNNINNCLNQILLWNEKLSSFVAIIAGADMRSYEKRCINSEQLNLHRMKVRLSYVERRRLLESKNNGTEITGLLGEAWNLIGDYINFTTSSEKMNEYYNTSDGLISAEKRALYLIKMNKTDVKVPLKSDNQHGTIMDSLSMTYSCYKLYVPPSFKSDDTWIFKMITHDALLTILGTMIFMSILNFFADKYIGTSKSMRHRSVPLSDHFLHTFATFTNQDSSPPPHVEKRSRILTITKRIFVMLFLTMATANLFYLMSRVDIDVPFSDIPSFLDKTDMLLIIRRASPGWFESVIKLSKTVRRKRIKLVESVPDMYELSRQCLNTTLWQSEHMHRTIGSGYGCSLVPVGACMAREGLSVGISKHFNYKRSIIIGMMKIREVGLMKVLEQHWLSPPKSFRSEQYKNVSLREVRIIFLIYLVGLLTSSIILLMENTVVIHKHYLLRRKWNQRLRTTARNLKIHQRC